MRVRQRHRHVQVGDPGLEAGVEDRLVEARVAGVQHRVGPHAHDQLDELRRGSEASTRSAAKRSGSPSRSTAACARSSATSASTTLLERRDGAGRSPRTPRRRRRLRPREPSSARSLTQSGDPRESCTTPTAAVRRYVAGGSRMLRRSARPRTPADVSTGLPSPSRTPPRPAGARRASPAGRRAAARRRRPRRAAARRSARRALGALAGDRARASSLLVALGGRRCSRSSRPGRWCCTCRAASRRTSATRCAPPGRSPGSGTRCSTTRCTCSTPTPSTRTR